MYLYRCKICGESYLGRKKPSSCPFCGAAGKYLVAATDWQEAVIPELSELSRKNLEKALELEVKNAEFYRCASVTAGHKDFYALFKALSKIESEHASTVSKALGVEKPVLEQSKDFCKPSIIENLMEAHEREKKATAFYQQAAFEAKEDRVKEIFSALAQIESSHVELTKSEEH